MTAGQRSAARDGDTGRSEKAQIDPFDPVALAARLAEARAQRAAVLASGRPAARTLRPSPPDEPAAAEGFVPWGARPDSSARSAPVAPPAPLRADPEGRVGGTRRAGPQQAEPAVAWAGRARVAAAFVAGSLSAAAAVLAPGLLQYAARGGAGAEETAPPASPNAPEPASIAAAAPTAIGSVLTDQSAYDGTSAEANSAPVAPGAGTTMRRVPAALAPPAVAAAQPESPRLDTLAALNPSTAAGVPEPVPPVVPRVPLNGPFLPAAAPAGAVDGRSLTEWARGAPTPLAYAVSPESVVGAGAIANLVASWAGGAAPSALVEGGERAGPHPAPFAWTAVSAKARFGAALTALPMPGRIRVGLDLEPPRPAAASAPRSAATASRPAPPAAAPARRQAIVDAGEQRAMERRVERMLREQLRELRRR